MQGSLGKAQFTFDDYKNKIGILCFVSGVGEFGLLYLGLIFTNIHGKTLVLLR